MLTYLPRFLIWPLWKRRSLPPGFFLAFIVVFFVLYPMIGSMAIILSFVPVAAVSWTMGAVPGLISGIIAVIGNLLLLTAVGEDAGSVLLRGGLSSLTLILLGGLAGWVSQLVERLHTYAFQLEQDRAKLRDEVNVREQTEKKLETALEQKEILLKEIHHRVKNNLQIISSLLNLQSDNIHDPKIVAHFQDSQNRVRTMALVHERLYRSGDLEHVNVKEYLQDLTGHLVRGYRSQNSRVNLALEVEDILLEIDIAIPCGLLVNELVSNALKHAFSTRHEGTIAIEMCSNGEQYRLKVQDNGIGMPPDINVQKTTSLGLQLVNSLTHQLGGTVEFQSPGTQITVCFPKTVSHELAFAEKNE